MIMYDNDTTNANVYGAVIMARPLRGLPCSFNNVNRRQVAAERCQPSDQARRLSLCVHL